MNASLRMRAWYENHFIQVFHADASSRTVVEYQATLNLWELLTDDKSLGEISSLDVANFRLQLSKLPGKRNESTSPATVNKHLRHLNHLIAKAGPAGPHNRDALGLISTTPWAKALREFQRRPRAAGLPAIRAFYRACPNDWWRAFVVCAFHLGSRCKALENLQEKDIDFGSRRITFQAEYDKLRCERLKPMSRTVVKHLVPLRGRGILQWHKCNSEFYKKWRKIADNAALTDEQRFTPHDLKRACGTQLARAGASTWAVKYMLDHAQNDVTGCSYLDPLEELGECVNRLPDPSKPVRVEETKPYDAR